MNAAKNKIKKKRVQINILHLLFILGILAAGIWFGCKWLLPVDEKDRIANRLEEISASAAKSGKEGIAVTLGQSKSLSDIAWTTINVKLSEFRFEGTITRDDIVKLFSQARQHVDTIDVEFADMTITIEGENTATAKGTVIIEITGMRDVFEDAGDIQTKWLKSPEDSQWYLTDVTIRPILSHSAR